MGQYYRIVNLDKKEYIEPHAFDDGAKLLEFGSGGNTTLALIVLLSSGNGQGMGDAHGCLSISGKWAGDRIVVAGDYGQKGEFFGLDVPEEYSNMNLSKYAKEYFEDISCQIAPVIAKQD